MSAKNLSRLLESFRDDEPVQVWVVLVIGSEGEDTFVRGVFYSEDEANDLVESVHGYLRVEGPIDIGAR